jgi:hypothetical protein
VLGIQNLIIPDGIFTQLVDGRADFLTDRIVSGPHPALEGSNTRSVKIRRRRRGTPVITAGTPTWEGQSVAKCQRLINRIGIRAFELECQHEVFGRAEGLALNFDENEHYIDLTAAEITHLVGLGQAFGGVDFGIVALHVPRLRGGHEGPRHPDRRGVQPARGTRSCARSGSTTQCVAAGVIKGDQLAIARFPVWADSAGAQDIIELNAAFARGWPDPVSGRT